APAPSSAPRNRGSGGPGPHGNPPPPPPAGRGPAQPQAPPPPNQPPAPFPEDALRDLLTWDMHSIMTANIPTVTRWPLQDDFALRATKADLMRWPHCAKTADSVLVTHKKLTIDFITKRWPPKDCCLCADWIALAQRNFSLSL
ncbi:unnamed protein product, partial [Vitrella brassicaformis CCMP3155]